MDDIEHPEDDYEWWGWNPDDPSNPLSAEIWQQIDIWLKTDALAVAPETLFDGLGGLPLVPTVEDSPERQYVLDMIYGLNWWPTHTPKEMYYLVLAVVRTDAERAVAETFKGQFTQEEFEGLG